MNVLKKLNQPLSSKPYNGFKNLDIGYHKIMCFRESVGKAYGRSVIVELKDEIVFMPAYLADKLDADDISDLNNCEETMYLYFGGKFKNKYWIVRVVDGTQMLEEINKKKNDDNSDDEDDEDTNLDNEKMEVKPLEAKKVKKRLKNKKNANATSLYCDEIIDSEKEKPTKKKRINTSGE